MGQILAAFLKLIKEGELVCGLGGSCKLKEISLRAGDKGPPIMRSGAAAGRL